MEQVVTAAIALFSLAWLFGSWWLAKESRAVIRHEREIRNRERAVERRESELNAWSLALTRIEQSGAVQVEKGFGMPRSVSGKGGEIGS